MKRLLSTAFVAGVGWLAISGQAAMADGRIALVVGNSNYQNVAHLPNPAKDASAVAAMFRNAGFDVVEAEDVINLEFKRALRRFESLASKADIAVVYYAGHGVEIGGTNYMIPVDAKLATEWDAPDEAISLERIVASIDAAKRLRLVILDACRTNPFLATMARRQALRSLSGGLGAVQPIVSDTLIAYAAKAGATAEDGDRDHSPFTVALLDNIAMPGVDVMQAFRRVRDQVMKLTGNRQEPFVYGSIGGENIPLVPLPPQPREPSIAEIKADYELAGQVGTRKAWEVFLNAHASGFYADLAREQLSKLAALERAELERRQAAQQRLEDEQKAQPLQSQQKAPAVISATPEGSTAPPVAAAPPASVPPAPTAQGTPEAVASTQPQVTFPPATPNAPPPVAVPRVEPHPSSVIVSSPTQALSKKPRTVTAAQCREILERAQLGDLSSQDQAMLQTECR